MRAFVDTNIMGITSVSSKGQVTIPKSLRQRLGIRQGSRIEFSLVGDHVELRVHSSPVEVPASGFGMLTSRKRAIPSDFDAASLLKRRSGSTPECSRVVPPG